MTVIVLVAAPEGICGHLTRWMVEVRAVMFVGNPSKRIRDHIWKLLAYRIGDGQAILVEPASTNRAGQSVPLGKTADIPSTSTD
ncbi:type I-E CRISPR-associated endoribonuclease Cas2e [Nonomuraea sp. NPDC002799]